MAFIGDVVLHGMHAYVSDAHTTAWLANLDRLAQVLRGVDTLYPGHGEPGGRELLTWQRDYLKAYRAAVADRGPPPLSAEKKQALEAHMLKYLPSEKLRFLIALGADAVARELAPAN